MEIAPPAVRDHTGQWHDDLRGRAERARPAAARHPAPWGGLYSQVTTSELYYRSPVAPGVVLVTGPGGRDMTCSPAIAEETFA